MTDPVEEHRSALEALAEFGHTELAKDARRLLEELEDSAEDTGGDSTE